jgi:hypothetical protein
MLNLTPVEIVLVLEGLAKEEVTARVALQKAEQGLKRNVKGATSTHANKQLKVAAVVALRAKVARGLNA